LHAGVGLRKFGEERNLQEMGFNESPETRKGSKKGLWGTKTFGNITRNRCVEKKRKK